MANLTIIIPDETELLQAAKQANAQHLKLLTDGKSTILSPIDLPGWQRMIVKVKPQPEQRLAA